MWLRIIAILFLLGTALAAIAVGTINAGNGETDEEGKLSSHLTIYVDEPVLRDGGLVIVAWRPIPMAEWQNIQSAKNPAEADLKNPKRAQVRAGDKLLGVKVTSPLSAVEAVYPEGGGYTFNLLPLPGSDRGQIKLFTEAISDGTGGINDPETGTVTDWPVFTSIYVRGSVYDAGWARLAESKFFEDIGDMEKSELGIDHFYGARTFSVSQAGIEKHVVDAQ